MSSESPKKKRKLRPLEDKETDITQISGKRPRNVLYTTGLWPSHVYVQAAIYAGFSKQISRAITEADKLFPCNPFTPLTREQGDRLHVSLSKELYPRHAGIAPLKEAVKRVTLSASSLPVISFTNFVLLTNDANSCQFLALQIGAGHPQLHEIVKSLDAELIKMHLPKYHDPPLFHASIAWRLPAADDDPSVDLSSLDKQFMPLIKKEIIHTSQISLRIGSDHFHYSS